MPLDGGFEPAAAVDILAHDGCGCGDVGGGGVDVVARQQPVVYVPGSWEYDTWPAADDDWRIMNVCFY